MSTALEDVGAVKRRKARISPALQRAVTLICHEGYSVTDAAQDVGMARESLSRALKRPAVKALRDGLKRAWMESQTSKAWKTVADLNEGAASEDVRHKAARTTLEAAGELGNKNEPPSMLGTLIRIVQQHDHGIQAVEILPGVITAPGTPSRAD